MNYNKVVYCTLQFEALHNWANCPLEEVNYLRHPHRHMFHIKAYKTVTHNDRDTEFIIMKHRIQEYLTKTYRNQNLGSMSCEMLAQELIEKFDLCQCDVSEDNENGAVLTVLENTNE